MSVEQLIADGKASYAEGLCTPTTGTLGSYSSCSCIAGAAAKKVGIRPAPDTSMMALIAAHYDISREELDAVFYGWDSGTHRGLEHRFPLAGKPLRTAAAAKLAAAARQEVYP